MAEKTAEQSAAVDKRSLNLYQKLAGITGEVGVIAKGGQNREQNYSFIEYAAVAGRLRELFASYGVVIIPTMGDRVENEIATSSGKKGVHVLVDFRFKVVNADKPDETFEVDWVGEASDYGDKATNKAATAALKYYFMRQFNISEKGDDPDAEAIDRGTVGQAAPATAPRTTTTSKEPASEAQTKKIFAALSSKGFSGEQQKVIVHRWAKVDSTKDLTKAQASALIEKIEATDKDKIASLLSEGVTQDQLKQMGAVVRAAMGADTDQATVLQVITGVALVENVMKLTKAEADTVIERLKGATEQEMKLVLPEPTDEAAGSEVEDI